MILRRKKKIKYIFYAQELSRPLDAISDYTEAIKDLEGTDGYKADADELPSSR